MAKKSKLPDLSGFSEGIINFANDYWEYWWLFMLAIIGFVVYIIFFMD